MALIGTFSKSKIITKTAMQYNISVKASIIGNFSDINLIKAIFEPTFELNIS